MSHVLKLCTACNPFNLYFKTAIITMIWFLCLSNQGFRWYTRRLRIDEDGDVADEFLDEIIPEGSISNDKAQGYK